MNVEIVMNNTYEQKCLELDKELAELLGWTEMQTVTYSYHSEVYNPDGILIGNSPFGGMELDIPRWTQDDAEAFRLMVGHEVEVGYNENTITADTYGDSFVLLEIIDFPDKQSAGRYAIVQAVVNKLKAN